MRQIGDSVLRLRPLSTYVLLLSCATPHKSYDARKCLYLKCIGRRREARRRCLRCQAAYNGSGLPDRSLSPRRRLLSSPGGGDPLRKMTITSPKIRLIKRSVNVPRDHPGNCHSTSSPRIPGVSRCSQTSRRGMIERRVILNRPYVGVQVSFGYLCQLLDVQQTWKVFKRRVSFLFHRNIVALNATYRNKESSPIEG